MSEREQLIAEVAAIVRDPRGMNVSPVPKGSGAWQTAEKIVDRLRAQPAPDTLREALGEILPHTTHYTGMTERELSDKLCAIRAIVDLALAGMPLGSFATPPAPAEPMPPVTPEQFDADVDEILAAAQGGWRSIDSAPKDGTEVLLFDNGVWCGLFMDGYWSDFSGVSIDQPTHWMPIPPAPDQGGDHE